MIAHRDLQLRQVDLALEPSRGRNADMVETRSREYSHFFRLVPEVIGTVSDRERTAVPQAKSRNWSGDGGWQVDCVYCEQQYQSHHHPERFGQIPGRRQTGRPQSTNKCLRETQTLSDVYGQLLLLR